MGSRIREVQGRLEMWLQFPLHVGWVCAEPDDSTQDGMCGMPVESEPCNIHHPTCLGPEMDCGRSRPCPDHEPVAVIDPGEGLLT